MHILTSATLPRMIAVAALLLLGAGSLGRMHGGEGAVAPR